MNENSREQVSILEHQFAQDEAGPLKMLRQKTTDRSFDCISSSEAYTCPPLVLRLCLDRLDRDGRPVVVEHFAY